MLLSKTPLTREEADVLFHANRIIGFEFAKEGHPKWGIAYWRWYAFKKEGKLYIIEATPNGDKLDLTLGIHQ